MMKDVEVQQNADFEMTNRRTKVNLIYVALGFLLNMSGYYSLEGLQSSLNSNTGMYSLSALYSSIVVVSLFLPPLAMDVLLCRKTMALGTITYALYTAANFYPQPYTLIPAAIILGTGSSILWSSMRVYISNLACLYARNTKENKEKVTAYFFGVFFMIFSLSMLIGNVMSSVVFQMTQNTTIQTMDVYETINFTEFQTQTQKNASTKFPIIAQKQCGLHNCNDQVKTNTSISTAEETKASVDKELLYILFSIYIIINLMAVAIFVFLLDEVPNELPLNNGVMTENLLRDNSEENNNKTIFASSISSNSIKNKGKELESANSTEETKSFIVRKVLETGKFIIFNHNGKLMIPLTLHLGQLQAFIYGRFTKYWITCYLGIENLGYIMAAFGFWAAIGGIVVGKVSKIVSRKVIIGTAVLLEVAMIALLLAWDPEKFSSIWIFIGISSCSGLLFSVYKTMLTAIYSLFFYKDMEAASAALSLWDPLGTSIAYALSTIICNQAALYILAGLLLLSTILYVIAEHNYATEKNEQRINLEDSNSMQQI